MFQVTRYLMISKTESGRESKEIPGSGLGSGTRWALPLFPETSRKFKIGLIRFWYINLPQRPWLVTNNTY